MYQTILYCRVLSNVHCTCFTQYIVHVLHKIYCTCIVQYIVHILYTVLYIILLIYYIIVSCQKLEGTAESGFPAKEAIVQIMKKEETKQDETVKA